MVRPLGTSLVGFGSPLGWLEGSVVVRVWLPYPATGGGADVYCESLATGLRRAGWAAILDSHSAYWMYWSWPLSFRRAPEGREPRSCAKSNWLRVSKERGPTCCGCTRVHCVFDAAFAPYRDFTQRLVHETLVRKREAETFRVADVVVTVSNYTAGSLEAVFGIKNAHVIHHGVDTEYFCPAPESDLRTDNRPLQLLFVGNLTRRKGADLLPSIMSALGSQFTLEYTSGLRTDDGIERVPNMRPLGRVSQTELRAAYRRADALLFPTRFEGFGLPAAEAMACGKAVVTTDCFIVA